MKLCSAKLFVLREFHAFLTRRVLYVAPHSQDGAAVGAALFVFAQVNVVQLHREGLALKKFLPVFSLGVADRENVPVFLDHELVVGRTQKDDRPFGAALVGVAGMVHDERCGVGVLMPYGVKVIDESLHVLGGVLVASAEVTIQGVDDQHAQRSPRLLYAGVYFRNDVAYGSCVGQIGAHARQKKG